MNTITLGTIRVIAQQIRSWGHLAVDCNGNMFPPSLYYNFLRELVSTAKPAIAVELGVCGGGGSYNMAKGHGATQVIGVDHANDYPDNIAFIQANFSNYKFMQMDSIEAAKFVPSEVGVLFLDTVHTKERTLAELDAWMPKMSYGGVIVFDDLFRDGMQDVWDGLPGQKERLDYLHIGGSPTDGGFGVLLV